MELWKEVEGYEGIYEVSSLGRIRSLDRQKAEGRGNYKRKGRVLQPSTADRYAVVTLCRGGRSKYHLLHRLVAKAFIPNPDAKPYVNHIDGNVLNNKVDNLEWVTNAENQNHSIYTLKNGVVTPVIAYDKVTGAEAYKFDSITRAGEWLLETGKTRDKTCLTGIIKSCKGKIPSYLGFKWQYVNKTQETK